MTLDGNADHTAVNPDAEIHDHYTALIKDADTLLYGRITYELMGFWKTLVEQPSGEKSMDEFAVMMDSVQKNRLFKHPDKTGLGECNPGPAAVGKCSKNTEK